ncbi:HPr family phosphocarrier protein [Pullulanibacillus sp. KACC 23026]|uniref:HPr family phosphocarrier protein n=1 Tax=Pullulanibacillus sp. KACC 23026 TaxID=3028315 RepID=UPI0023B13F72|nr:HPr family phosphocarrier protein [Pullulanibacillus sp. KACC 23026]WEG13630.1 HPr family phosphocarrier protein [Pullulanibacillus sp. KACC 23026]
MIQKEVKIQLKSGLQARPAALFVQEANRYRSEVNLISNEKTANAKSIMGIMSLAIGHGETIQLQVSGPDEEEAMQALVTFVQKED